MLDAVIARELAARTDRDPHGVTAGGVRIVAVGAGPGAETDWLASHGEVVALDLDGGGDARSDASARFVRASANALPLGAGAADLVCALDVIEHLDDDAGALREMARVLRRPGVLLVTVPAMPSLWGAHDEVNHHRRRYTRRTLRDAFARAEVPLTWLSPFNTLLFPPVAAVRWSRRLLRADGPPASTGDFRRTPPTVARMLEGTLALERFAVGRVPLPVGVSLVACARVC